MELARNLKIDSVSRLPPDQPLVRPRGCSIADAVAAMRAADVGCLLVCDGEQLVGVFTERDLMRRVIARGLDWSGAIEHVMTPNPVTLALKDSVRTAIRRMEKGGYRNLPVIDDDHRPVGIVSVMRIVHYLAEHFPVAVYNLPPDPHAWPTSPDGG
jgi:CBS domain-containing protein